MKNLNYVCLKGFWLNNYKFRKGDPFNLKLVTETQCEELEKTGKIAKADANYEGPAPERRPTSSWPPEAQAALNESNEPTSTRVSAARDPRNQHTSETVNNPQEGDGGEGTADHDGNPVADDGTAQGVARDVEKSDSVEDAADKADGKKPAAPARTPAIQRQDAPPARRPNRPGAPAKDSK